MPSAVPSVCSEEEEVAAWMCGACTAKRSVTAACAEILWLLEQSQHECYCRTDACLITVTVNYTSTHCYSLKLFPNLPSANGVLAVYTIIL